MILARAPCLFVACVIPFAPVCIPVVTATPQVLQPMICGTMSAAIVSLHGCDQVVDEVERLSIEVCKILTCGMHDFIYNGVPELADLTLNYTIALGRDCHDPRSGNCSRFIVDAGVSLVLQSAETMSGLSAFVFFIDAMLDISEHLKQVVKHKTCKNLAIEGAIDSGNLDGTGAGWRYDYEQEKKFSESLENFSKENEDLKMVRNITRIWNSAKKSLEAALAAQFAKALNDMPKDAFNALPDHYSIEAKNKLADIFSASLVPVLKKWLHSICAFTRNFSSDYDDDDDPQSSSPKITCSASSASSSTFMSRRWIPVTPVPRLADVGYEGIDFDAPVKKIIKKCISPWTLFKNIIKSAWKKAVSVDCPNQQAMSIGAMNVSKEFVDAVIDHFDMFDRTMIGSIDCSLADSPSECNHEVDLLSHTMNACAHASQLSAYWQSLWMVIGAAATLAVSMTLTIAVLYFRSSRNVGKSNLLSKALVGQT